MLREKPMSSMSRVTFAPTLLALLLAGVIKSTDTTFLEVKTSDGQRYFFGDAINACVMEGNEQFKRL